MVQEAGIKTIPKKKKCRKAKWLSEDPLQIAEERGEAKGKGEGNIHLRMQSSNEQQGEIRKPSSVINAKKEKKNNPMGRTRDLFKKIRDTKGIVHAKMGTIKDRNGMDLTRAEDINKR